MDVVGSLRKIAKELIQIGAEVNEPYDLVARIGGASFMLNWIADGLEREINCAYERGKRLYGDL